MTTDYYINHRLRSGLARLEGLVHMLKQETENAANATINNSYTIELMLREVEELKRFTEAYANGNGRKQ